MINNLFLFAFSLFLVIKGATLATRYASKLAESFRISKYTVGFIAVAIISILPETFISINSVVQGVPSFALGVLFGSNIADLTLIFAIIIAVAGRGIKIESKILKNHSVYPFMLVIPLILGLDGYFSRIEGLALIAVGVVFYYISLKNGIDDSVVIKNTKSRLKNLIFLILGMIVLLVGSYFTVESAQVLAENLGINPILIGMLVVGLGTTMPELFFALKAVKKRDDSLAVGDILGTVLADATIVLGILAFTIPFSFPTKIIYVTGVFMVAASIILFKFMRSGKKLTQKESYLLFAFWLVFVFVEFFVNQ